MNMRVIVLSLLLLALPFGAIAQTSPSTTQDKGMPPYSGWGHGGFMGMMNPRQIDRSLDTLKSTLSLSDDQVSKIRQLVQSRRERMDSVREDVQPKFEALMRLMNRPNPDPNAVGRAALDLKQAHDRSFAEQASLQRDFIRRLNSTTAGSWTGPSGRCAGCARRRST